MDVFCSGDPFVKTSKLLCQYEAEERFKMMLMRRWSKIPYLEWVDCKQKRKIQKPACNFWIPKCNCDLSQLEKLCDLSLTTHTCLMSTGILFAFKNKPRSSCIVEAIHVWCLRPFWRGELMGSSSPAMLPKLQEQGSDQRHTNNHPGVELVTGAPMSTLASATSTSQQKVHKSISVLRVLNDCFDIFTQYLPCWLRFAKLCTAWHKETILQTASPQAKCNF